MLKKLVITLVTLAVFVTSGYCGDYYTHGNFPSPSSPASSAAMRAELDLIASGFAKLPSLAGNAGKVVVINGGATGLTTTTGTLSLSGNFSVTGAFAVTFVTQAPVTLTLPAVSGTLATWGGTETLTNKTILSPLGITKTDVGLGNVDNTSDGTKNAATATVSNKTFDSTNTWSGGTVNGTVNGVINVKSAPYNAACDGTTDDTAAFQAAANVGGAIFVPAGTCIVDYLTLGVSQEWSGEGAVSIIKKKANSVSTTYTGNYFSYLFNVTSANVTLGFSHLTFDGNYLGQATTRTGTIPANTGSAINNYNASATVMATGGVLNALHATATSSADRMIVRFTNNTFKQWTTIAIYFSSNIDVGAYASLLVEGNTFLEAGPNVGEYHDGVSLYDGIVYPASGYSFSASGRESASIYVTDAAKTLIRGNTFLDTRSPYAGTLTTGFGINVYNMPACGILATIIDGTTDSTPEWSELVIEGNHFSGLGRSSWQGNGLGVIDYYARGGNSTIANNVFINSYNSPIRGKANNKNLAITGNIIEGVNNGLGINIGPATYEPQVGNYTISNNVVRNAGSGIQVTGTIYPVANPNAGITDDADNAVNHIVITGNVIENITNIDVSAMDAAFDTSVPNYGWGIQVRQASDVLIANNIIRDTNTVADSNNLEHGIYTLLTGDAMTITGNIVHDVAQSGIVVSQHTGSVTVTHNNIKTAVGSGINISNTGVNLVAHNTVIGTGNTGIVAGSSLTTAEQITGNYVENVAGNSASSIYGIDTGAAVSLTSVTMRGNQISTVTNAGAGAAYGIRVQLPSPYVDANTMIVDGNIIHNTQESGIFLQDATGILSNNVFKNVNSSASTAHGAIFINGVTNVGKLQIHGNTTDINTLFPTTGGASWPTIGTLTIASGVIAAKVNPGLIVVDTEGAAGTDDLDTINGIPDMSMVTIRAANSARDVVLKDGTGNLRLNGDFTLTTTEDRLILRSESGFLYEVSRSDNL